RPTLLLSPLDPPVVTSMSPFFLSWSATHQHLHSFPTRRSSDLTGEHPGVFKNKNDVTGRNQSYYRRDHFSDLLKEQQDVNHTLIDRKSTRLNSSHVSISYAVFCLKKKKTKQKNKNIKRI